MLKIVLPTYMPTTFEHFKAAGRAISIRYVGEDEVAIGEIESTGDSVLRLRSYDIPVEIEDTCDVGLCGSDWVREKELELGIKFEVLNDYLYYNYGRTFDSHPPTLDLIAREDDPVDGIKQLKPGSIVLTEYPQLTREFLEPNGFEVAEFTRTRRSPRHPDEFRKWCVNNELIGIRVVHGSLAGLVNIGSGYGVMVNETGRTLRANNLKVIDTIHEIKILLIADQEAVTDEIKGPEIESLHRDLDRAYLTIYGESEAALRNFKERR